MPRNPRRARGDDDDRAVARALAQLIAAGRAAAPAEPVDPAPPMNFDFLPRSTAQSDEDGAKFGECTICRDDIKGGETCVRLPCMCTFHEKCILPWLHRDHRCPNDKVSVIQR